MAVLGMFVTTNLEANERSHAWRLGIMDQYPDAAPLAHMIYRTGKERVSDPYFRWYERAFNPRELTVSAGTITTAGTVAIDDTTTYTIIFGANEAYNCRTGTLLYNPSRNSSDGSIGELVRVTTDPTNSTTVTVVRGLGATGNAVNWVAADKVQVIGNAQAEGAALGTAIGSLPTAYANYCQIFRNVADISRTLAKTKLRTGDKRADAQKTALLEHELDKEWAFLFGRADENLSTTPGPTRTTGGLFNRISTNVYDAADAVTLEDFNDWLADVFQEGSSEKLMLCGSSALLTLENMARAYSWQVADIPKQDSFGMGLKSWKNSFGTCMIKEHKLLSKSTTYRDWAFLVDPDKFVYRYVDDTQWLPNRQDNGADRITGEYLAEIGLEIHQEYCHGIMKNCSAFAG